MAAVLTRWLINEFRGTVFISLVTRTRYRGGARAHCRGTARGELILIDNDPADTNIPLFLGDRRSSVTKRSAARASTIRNN